MTVASAHRSPERAMRLVTEAPARGVKVFIVGAGAAAHLAGVVAAHTTMPVIGVPIDSSALKGLDALLSTVQMPPGVPVATVSIGKPGATNAGVLAAQILAVGDPAIADKSSAYKKKLAEKVEAAAAKLKRAVAPDASMKYSHRHVRLPRQSGGLAPPRGGPARRGRRAASTGGGRRGRRQHLFGDGDGRPGCAPDDPAHRARESAARIVVTGCYARGGPTDVAALPGVVRVVRNDVKLDLDRLLDRPATAERFGDGDGPCGAAIEPGSPDAPRSRCACRPAAISTAPTASSRRRAARAAACRSRDVVARGRARSRTPASRRSRSPASISGRTAGICAGRRRCRSAARARPRRRGRDVPHQLARADGLHAGDRRPGRGSGGRFAPHFHLPLQHASDRMLAAMRRPYTLDFYAAGRRHRRAPAARLDRHRHDRRVPRRNRRGLRREPATICRVAAVARARVSLLRSSGHRGRGA